MDVLIPCIEGAMKQDKAIRWWIVVLGLVAMVAAQAGRAGEPESAVIPDTNLRVAVEAVLGIQNPTPTDLLQLTRLSCEYAGIRDLTGLNLATNLVYLDLQGNQIRDAAPLAGLTGLTYLDIQDNQVADVSPLASLTGLTLLDLQGNGISDVTSLAGLTRLTSLCLWDDHVTDLRPLSSLTHLNRLFLVGNGIIDLAPLASLTNLGELYLSNNRISDVSPLAGLTGLTYLWLNANQLSDATPLASLTRLTLLDLGGNQLSDVGPLAGLTRLEVLRLSNNRISSLGIVASMTCLTELTAADNPLRDIPAFAGLTGLHVLELEGCGLQDAGCLAGVTSLLYLDLSRNQIRDLAALAGLTRLGHLDLSGNQIVEIGALAPLTSLTWLDLAENQISRITTLGSLVGLTHLTLGSNQIQDVGPLGALVDLSVLGLETNRIEDISSLAGLSGLTWLDLSGNPLTELSRTVWMPQILARNPSLSVAAEPQVSLTVESGVGGTVLSPGEGTHAFARGESVWLEARCDPLFEFAGWTGSFSSECQALWVTLDANMTVRPIFISLLDTLDVRPKDAGDESLSDEAVEDGTPEHPFRSIQDAIQVAADGTTIFVHPGRYKESLDFMGKAVAVTRWHCDADSSLSPDPDCQYPIIDAQGQGTAVSFVRHERSTTQLDGFVITGGRAGLAGAIACQGSSPVISHCLIVGNQATSPGGGCVHCVDSNAVFINCTISGNQAGLGGGALVTAASGVTLTNSILWDDSPAEICVTSGRSPDLQYCDVQGGWPGGTNLDKDPLFVFPGMWVRPADRSTVVQTLDPNAVWVKGDYHLMSQEGHWDEAKLAWISDPLTSPCIDAGDPNTPVGDEISPAGPRINLGAYGGTDQASKSLGS
jgi:internalin A